MIDILKPILQDLVNGLFLHFFLTIEFGADHNNFHIRPQEMDPRER
jgi:hypothetical protein